MAQIGRDNAGQASPFAPTISSIEVVGKGKVRRARLYYLRDLQGKAARLKERTAVTTDALHWLRDAERNLVVEDRWVPHALRNAGIPYVTLLGWEVIRAIAGYTVFSYRVFRGKTGELRYA